MIIEVKPARGAWVAAAETKLRARGDTAEDAIVALKRASLLQLADGDVAPSIEWTVVPGKDVAARDKRALSKLAREQRVGLSADIHVKETRSGWTWSSDGGAVSGTSPSLARARDDAARASWRAVAEHLDDEDVARAGAMLIEIHVTTTSAWVVDHLAPGPLRLGYSYRASFAALKSALGPPWFDPFGGEPLYGFYGWGLRGKRERSAWLGVQFFPKANTALNEKGAAAVAKRRDEFELAATDDKSAKSVIAWLRARTG